MEFSEDPELQSILFGLFLAMYLIAVLGNLLIILAVISDYHLHTPMYFFLSNLSLTDIGLISTTVPKMVVGIHTHNRIISYVNCLMQISILSMFGSIDDMLLTVMAYDRFMAICHPLHYSVIMNPHHCAFLVLLSFLMSLLDSLMQILIALQLTCFKDVEVSNFFCHSSDLLNLACPDVVSINIIIISYLSVVIFGLFPICGIFWSYYKIISSILKITSSSGRYKAFSTCGSHLSVVFLFYGTGIGTYFSSAVLHSQRKGLVASLMYTAVTPMLNPFVYSLRNRDISGTLKRLYKCKISFQVL